jgi:hypothetical protein
MPWFDLWALNQTTIAQDRPEKVPQWPPFLQQPARPRAPCRRPSERCFYNAHLSYRGKSLKIVDSI